MNEQQWLERAKEVKQAILDRLVGTYRSIGHKDNPQVTRFIEFTLGVNYLTKDEFKVSIEPRYDYYYGRGFEFDRLNVRISGLSSPLPKRTFSCLAKNEPNYAQMEVFIQGALKTMAEAKKKYSDRKQQAADNQEWFEGVKMSLPVWARNTVRADHDGFWIMTVLTREQLLDLTKYGASNQELIEELKGRIA